MATTPARAHNPRPARLDARPSFPNYPTEPRRASRRTAAHLPSSGLRARSRRPECCAPPLHRPEASDPKAARLPQTPASPRLLCAWALAAAAVNRAILGVRLPPPSHATAAGSAAAITRPSCGLGHRCAVTRTGTGLQPPPPPLAVTL
ncbi:hypothetical protein PVAP13_2KG170500 [Panicum virgatum]|uniref:Uncharacterized protein n=1 Tax=Panicum virgatum TaxID=38727 RepID=A0A8T0W1L0_PANVG|nr:hypothetical protein PVAP13_2KG170500 [Panicum virgatum]